MVVQLNRAAQQVRAADRFAREILAFLKSSCAARSRQLTHRPLGCPSEYHLTSNMHVITMYLRSSALHSRGKPCPPLSKLAWSRSATPKGSAYPNLFLTNSTCPPMLNSKCKTTT